MPDDRLAGYMPETDTMTSEQGTNWLLAIGIDQYAHHRKLQNAVADAEGFATVMTQRYGFKHLDKPLYNEAATQHNIREAIGKCEKLEENDRLIIFYSGHGWYRPKAQLGYIVPSEAKDNPHTDFISTSFIMDTFKIIDAKHVLLIVDCCFGGSFGKRNVHVKETNKVAKTLNLKRSRMILASGGDEPVKDGYASSVNSPFMSPLLDILKSNEQPLFILSNVFPLLREKTNYNAEQMPLYNPLAGHDNGEMALMCTDLDSLEEKAYKMAIIAENIDIYEDFLLNDEFINVEFEVDITQRLTEKRASEAWKRIENSEHIEDFIDFIKRFSNSLFVDLAKEKREHLKKIKADKRQTKEVEQKRQLEAEQQRIELQKQVEKEITEGKKAYYASDYAKAFSLLFKHRDNVAFDTDAQTRLSYMYDKGFGVKQDSNEAEKWLRKAAEQGHSVAQNNLGIIYRDGKGLKQDYNEAVKWFQKAAEQGQGDAQTALGAMYELGQGVEQNYKEASKWFQKAAEQGNVFGQHNLGRSYEMGRGVTKDINEAIRWFRLSAKQGIQQSKDALKRLGYPE